MANYAVLKAAIEDIIKTNGNNEITGELLQDTLIAMINSLGAEYQFAGVATIATNPGTPDHNVFYIAGDGLYTNFGATNVPKGCLGVFSYNGNWTYNIIDATNYTLVNVNELINQSTPFASADAARSAISQKYRKPGLTITYLLSTGENTNQWVQDMFIGDDVTDWDVADNWFSIGMAIDDVADADSNNLMTSSGVFRSTLLANIYSGLLKNGGFFVPNHCAHIDSATSLYDGLQELDDYDCIIVALGKDSKSLVVKNNTPLRFVWFSEYNFDVANVISYNSVGVAPTGAKMCIINFLKSSNPSYDNLNVIQYDIPASIEDLDAKANNLVKNLYPQVSKKEIINIAGLTLHPGRCGTDGTFVNVTSGGGTHLTLARGTRQSITVTASATNNTYMVFLNRLFTEPTKNYEDYTRYICLSQSGTRIAITAGSTNTYTIPDDCEYIIIGYDSASSSTGYRPQAVYFDADGEFINRIKALESTTSIINQESDTLIVDLSGPYQAGWPMGNNTFANVTTLGGTHITVNVADFKKFRIRGTVSEGCNSYFFFANSSFQEPSANGESYASYLCAGTGRIAVPYNTDITYNIPDDCAYVIIGYRAQEGQGPYRPQSAQLYTDAGVIERLDYIEANTIKSIKLLAIGNSFSRDSLSYVPILLKSICPSVKVQFGILYKGSSSLQDHWDNRESATYYPSFDIFDDTTNKWVSIVNKGLDYGLTYTDWDIITLQQNSANSNKYNTYQPYLNNLIDYIATKCHNYKIGWLLTHSYADGYTTEWTSEQMADGIRAAAQRVMDETTVDILLPYGTAIQNARSNNVLNLIGGGGGLCYSDYIHLQEGLGCQIAAYANAIVLLLQLGIIKSINGNGIRIDSDFVNQYNIPEPHGNPVGSIDANCVLAQKAASLAVKLPFVTSQV